MERVLCIFLGYALGLIQTGYLFGRTQNMDIREHGSGNAGTTNTMRVLGWKAGIIVFLGDFLKAFIPCILIRILFRESPLLLYPLLLYMGLGVVLGHSYPFYLSFKGGKGVASTAGIIAALDYRVGLIALFTFIISVFLTKYVSLGSILVMLVLIIGGSLASGSLYGLSGAALWEFRILLLLIGGLSIYRHKENIKRLLYGSENKISVGKKAAERR